jgi:hypothetical protein
MSVPRLSVGCVPSSATYPRCGDRDFLVGGFVSGGGAATGREPFWFGEQLVYNVWVDQGERRRGYSELWTLEAGGRLTIRVTPTHDASFSLVYGRAPRQSCRRAPLTGESRISRSTGRTSRSGAHASGPAIA